MLKRVAVPVAVVVGLTAVALAAVLIQGARGRGVAVNAAGVRGHFSLDVVKATDGASVHIEGGMLWESRLANDGRGIRIEMLRARQFFKDGQTARFMGPARAVVLSPVGTRVFEGLMHVVVRDLRDPQNPSNQRDTIALQFHAVNAVFDYSFEGVVVEGDIRVFERVLD